jgi:GMP synthase (glutamine-hydrolysing)
MLVLINNGKLAHKKCCAFMFKRLLTILKQINVNYVVLDNSEKSNKLIIKNKSKISGFIFSSSPKRIDTTCINELITTNYVLFNFNVPILGICFGHQIICKLNFSKSGCYKNNYEYNNLHETKFKHGFDLLKNVKEDNMNYNFHLYHHDFIVTKPHNYQVYAEGKIKNNTFINAVKHNDLPIYGIQFHPEYNLHKNPSTINVYLNFLDICGLKYNKSLINIEKIESIPTDTEKFFEI